MKISNSNKIIMASAGLGLVFCMFLAYLILFGTDQDLIAGSDRSIYPLENHSHPSAVGFSKTALEPTLAKDPELENPAEQREEVLGNQIVMELQRDYGKNISRKSTQASLFDIKKYIISLFPESNGKAKFYEILKRAFPDFADEIMKTLDKLEEYNRWLADNETLLSSMSESERTAALWEKRKALFGKEAEEIWSGELLASDARKKSMIDTVAVLEKSYDTAIEEKLDMYQNALRETYENTPDEFVLNYNGMLSKVFFSIESVQEELKQMDPEQRQYKINQIRREMGLSEEAVEKMAAYDADSNQRWEIGLKYTKERDALISQFEGQEREDKLKALREQYFNDEAETIELEEKEEFFRFKRPRIFGRN